MACHTSGEAALHVALDDYSSVLVVLPTAGLLADTRSRHTFNTVDCEALGAQDLWTTRPRGLWAWLL